MMKKLFGVLLLFSFMTSLSVGQETDFPELKDRPALDRWIPEFAAKALGDKQDPLNRLFLLLAAGRYGDARTTFEDWQKSRSPRPAAEFYDPAIRIEVYVRAKAMQIGDGESFERAFRKVFAEVFSKMNDRAAYEAGWYLGTPASVFESDLQAQLQRRRDVLELVRSYVTARAVSEFSPLVDAAVAADDANRFVIQTDVRIKTAERATISAIVVRRKDTETPQPTVLTHHVYTDEAFNLHLAKGAAVRGYASVVSDPRGKRLSPDPIEPWEHDAQDTYAVIDWISKQPWSDGRVGMYGDSYMGFAQWAAAKTLHPALKTIVPAAASFPGNGIPMQNNVFQLVNYVWPFYVTNNKYLDNEINNDQQRWTTLPEKWYRSGRPFREVDAVDGTPNPLFQQQMKHPSYDAYWQAMQPYKNEFTRINIPVLTLTGYFDEANSAAVNYLVDHYKYNPRANHYLVIGPYTHRNVGEASKPAFVRDYAIDPSAQIDSVELVFQWFDYVLRGKPRPALIGDRINYQVMGANEWRHAPSIAAMSNQKLKLYLSGARTGDRYTLAAAKPAPATMEQVVDFADRSTSNNLSPQAVIEERVDYPTRLVFASKPFDENVSVDGMVRGVLQVTIDKRDMDFAVALYEQMPDGKYFNLSYYLGRASYARDMATRKLLTPGRKTSIPFERTPLISRQLSKGSRLVVLVTVNKNAFAQINSGSGKDVSDESIADAKAPLHVLWHSDSYIEVPIRNVNASK